MYSQVLPDLVSAHLGLSPVLRGAPMVLSSAPMCSQTYVNHSHGTQVSLIRDLTDFEGWPECPPWVCGAPKLDAFKFMLHILSDTPGGSEWKKYILLMCGMKLKTNNLGWGVPTGIQERLSWTQQQHRKGRIECGMNSVSKGSNPLVWFRVRVGTGTEPWQRFYHMKNLDHWHLGWFPPQNPAFGSPDVSLQFSIWVLIVSWHEVYSDCAVLAALSPPAFRFGIQPIFVESLSKTREFLLQSTLISQPPNKYQSDLNSESGR
jgi:hypothetical protein